MDDVNAEPGVRERADAFQAWLETRPPQVSAVLAVRVGLRVLPFVVAEPVGGRFTPKAEREILSAFRYAALGRLSTKRSSESLNAFATLLNTIAYAQMTGATATIQEASRTAALIGSAFGTGKDTALRAAYAVMCSASSSVGPPWDALAIDQARIEAGEEPMVLLDEPVWLGLAQSPPVPDASLSRWETMRSTLEDADPSWRVWTHWYQGRLRGDPAGSDQTELLRLTLFPDAIARMGDGSWDGLRRWEADLEANRLLLKGSPRKSNRVVARLLDGFDGLP